MIDNQSARDKVNTSVGVTPYLLTPKEAADLLGCSLDELRQRRKAGAQPPFYRVTARTIRYGVDDVLKAAATA